MSYRYRALSPGEIETAASDWILRRETGLDEAERAEFERWLSADPRHSAALARANRTWSILDRPRAAGRADEMVHALSSRAAQRRRHRIVSAVGATVALIAVSWIGWGPRVEESSSAAGAVVLKAERRTLPDGGIVELKPGAEIAVDYGGPLRRVALLRGEALFQVAENKTRAFVVDAGGVEVVAVGTAFLVQLGDGEVDVVVTHGRVAVQKPTQVPEGAVASGGMALAMPLAAPASSTLVDAGNRVTVEIASTALWPKAIAISPAEVADRLAWRGPRLEFSDTPLAQAVAMMNERSKLRLVIEDPALAALPVNGLFRADNAETLVRLLEASLGIKAERSGDTVVLRRAQ